MPGGAPGNGLPQGSPHAYRGGVRAASRLTVPLAWPAHSLLIAHIGNDRAAACTSCPWPAHTTPFPPERSACGGEPVHATDGNIGQIQGLVIDSGSRQVTHVLLQEGHVFGRKVVAIPIAAVTGAGENGIQLNITRQQVKDLPSGWHRSPG